MSRWPMPDKIPGVVQCRGGWFAIRNESDNCGSGPWRSREAAEAVLIGDFDKAQRLDRKAHP